MTRGVSDFFLSQRTGRWRWVWLLVSIPAGLMAWIVAMLALFFAFDLASASGSDWATEVSDLLFGESESTTRPDLLSVELVVLGAGLWIAAAVGSVVHGRSIRSLVAPLDRFDWSIVRRVVIVQAALTLATVPLFFTPWLDTPDVTDVGLSNLAWILPLALFTLVQTSGEDVLFKGFLLRQLGAASKVFWLAPVVVVSVFVSLHVGNPDFQAGFWMLLPLFVASELMVIYFTMRTGGMEVALCWHWINNATIFLVVADRTTQANDVTLFAFDEDPSTLIDDAVTNGIYVGFLVLQFVAFVWRRSPFFLESHTWTPPATTIDIDGGADQR